MYKYDTHVHTSEGSPCGRIAGKDLIKRYKDMGYTGIIITDHYVKRYIEALKGISWREKMKGYLSGYYDAREAGYENNIDVFLGIELSLLAEKEKHFLLYGIDEDFLLDNPALYDKTLKDIQLLKEDHDILLYQAHPYRDICRVVEPHLIDGVEVYNGSPRRDSRNHLALKFARANDLLMISGSDAHRPEDIGKAGVKTKEKIESSKELMDSLKNIKEENLIKDSV